MKNTLTLCIGILLITPFFLNSQTAAEKAFEKRKASLKAEVQANVEKQAKLAQVMVDKVFSFSELGFQEVETSKYLTKILEENGFTVKYCK
jgi:aminobenzoyl-glutamate utilization protein B